MRPVVFTVDTVVRCCKMLILPAEFLNIFFKLLALWMGLDFMKSAVGQIEIRVPPERHRPVEDAVEFVNIHVEILGGFDDPVDVSIEVYG